MNIIYLQDLNKINSNNSHFYTTKLFFKNGENILKSINFTDNLQILNPINCWINQDNFDINIENTWEELYSLSLQGGTETLNKFLSGLIQMPLITDKLFRQVWVKPEVTTFKLDLNFIAHTDPITEVFAPLMFIAQTVLPSINTSITNTVNGVVTTVLDAAKNIVGGIPYVGDSLEESLDRLKKELTGNFLSPPGYYYDNNGDKSKGDNIYAIYKIKIGEFLSLNNLLLKGANISFDINNMYLDSNNKRTYPLIGKVTLDFVSEVIWTKSTIKSLVENFYTNDDSSNVSRSQSEIVSSIKSLLDQLPKKTTTPKPTVESK